MKRRGRNRIIWCDNLHFPFYYGFCPNEQAWTGELNRLCKGMAREPYPMKQEATGGLTTIFRNDSGKSTSVVTLNKKFDSGHTVVEVLKIITHEAVHVWQELCDCIGETDPPPSHEFEAYTIAHLSECLMSAYVKLRRPKFTGIVRGMPHHAISMLLKE